MEISRSAVGMSPWLFLAVAAGTGCGEEPARRLPATPAAKPAARARPASIAPPACQPLHGRPAASEAEVRETQESGVVLVGFAATPSDGACETLDILFRLRSGLLVGEPDRQVEVVWSSERDIDEGARLSFLVGGSPVALPSEVARSGSRVVVSTRAPAALLARYGSEARPTILVSGRAGVPPDVPRSGSRQDVRRAGRKIELSERQKVQLGSFLQHLPSYGVVRTGRAADPAPRSAAPRKRPDTADPAAGKGWFCVEARGDGPRRRISSCHRTSAECEQSRASLQATSGAVSDCAWSSAAACYAWQAGESGGRSCFFRPSQCQRDRLLREEAAGQTDSLWMGSCHSAP